MRNKDNVIFDFNEMIFKSWTFEKMTKKEQDKWCIDIISDIRTKDALKGNYNQRWEILQAIYHAYLIGIGYSGYGWREDNEEEKASF